MARALDGRGRKESRPRWVKPCFLRWEARQEQRGEEGWMCLWDTWGRFRGQLEGGSETLERGRGWR